MMRKYFQDEEEDVVEAEEVAEAPAPEPQCDEEAIDKTKQPRIWVGGGIRVDYWVWSCYLHCWSQHCQTIHGGSVFIGGAGPRPAINPTGMQLAECSEVDWLD